MKTKTEQVLRKPENASVRDASLFVFNVKSVAVYRKYDKKWKIFYLIDT